MDRTAQTTKGLAIGDGHVLDDVPKLRKCLKCGKMFESAGFGNRLCKPCRKKNKKIRYREPVVRIRQRWSLL